MVCSQMADPLAIKKRERAVNFTNAETKLLLDIVCRYSTVVENKTTDAATWKEKSEAWNKITAEFNSNSGVASRSTKTIRLKYEGIKKSVKKKFAANGGGEGIETPLTDVDIKLKKICSQTIFAQTAKNDSDSLEVSTASMSQTENSESNEDMLYYVRDNEETEEKEVFMVPQSAFNCITNTSSVTVKQEQDSTMKDTVPVAKGDSWSRWKKNQLKKKINNFNRLIAARHELVNVQIQIAKNEEVFKKLEYEQTLQHKQELHELKILHMKNEEKRRKDDYEKSIKF